jgi:hypothetical protein
MIQSTLGYDVDVQMSNGSENHLSGDQKPNMNLIFYDFNRSKVLHSPQIGQSRNFKENRAMALLEK